MTEEDRVLIQRHGLVYFYNICTVCICDCARLCVVIYDSVDVRPRSSFLFSFLFFSPSSYLIPFLFDFIFFYWILSQIDLIRIKNPSKFQTERQDKNTG